MRRSIPIWITGVGTLNPLGTCLASTTAGLLAGRSGVRALPLGRTGKGGSLEPWIGGYIEQIPPPVGFAAAGWAACASRNVALAQGRRWVQQGWVDVCLCGGIDVPLSPMGLACFDNLGAVSRRRDEPEKVSRPFDRDRDGLVMGEGGALFVLES